MGKIKEILPYLIVTCCTFIVIGVFNIFLVHNCDDFVNVALTRRDLDSFILTEVSGVQILVSCVIFFILTLFRLSACRWLFFSILWELLFHILLQSIAMHSVVQTTLPTNKEISKRYDHDVRASSVDNVIVPIWLQYVYVERNCCGIYNDISIELLGTEIDYNYLQSIDDTLKRLTCSEDKTEMRQSGILRPRTRSNFYGNITAFQGQYNAIRYHKVTRARVMAHYAPRESEGKNGCGDDIRGMYEECVGKCFRNMVIYFIFGFIPLVCFLTTWKAERRKIDETEVRAAKQKNLQRTEDEEEEQEYDKEKSQESDHQSDHENPEEPTEGRKIDVEEQ